jgi:hypothetical protein
MTPIYDRLSEIGLGGLPGASHAEQILFYLAAKRSQWVDVNSSDGKPLHVKLNPRDLAISKYLYKNGTYESQTISSLEHYIQKGDSVVDVGANIGYFTVGTSQSRIRKPS